MFVCVFFLVCRSSLYSNEKSTQHMSTRAINSIISEIYLHLVCTLEFHFPVLCMVASCQFNLIIDISMFEVLIHLRLLVTNAKTHDPVKYPFPTGDCEHLCELERVSIFVTKALVAIKPLKIIKKNGCSTDLCNFTLKHCSWDLQTSSRHGC